MSVDRPARFGCARQHRYTGTLALAHNNEAQAAPTNNGSSGIDVLPPRLPPVIAITSLNILPSEVLLSFWLPPRCGINCLPCSSEAQTDKAPAAVTRSVALLSLCLPSLSQTDRAPAAVTRSVALLPLPGSRPVRSPLRSSRPGCLPHASG